MLSYIPGETLAHRLDPRSKLLAQAGVAIAAMASPSVRWLAAIYAIAGVALLAARLSPLTVLRAYWPVLAVLAVAPLVGGVALGPPWYRLDPALRSLFAVARIPPVLAVSAAYIHATPVRETRAAIQWLLPGRAGRLLGVGVSLVFRFFPLVVRDVRTVRAAIRARGGERRPLRDRARLLAVRSLDRATARADRLAVALQARCFAWNPTLPALEFSRVDYPVVGLGVVLTVAPLVRLLALAVV